MNKLYTGAIGKRILLSDCKMNLNIISLNIISNYSELGFINSYVNTDS